MREKGAGSKCQMRTTGAGRADAGDRARRAAASRPGGLAKEYVRREGVAPSPHPLPEIGERENWVCPLREGRGGCEGVDARIKSGHDESAQTATDSGAYTAISARVPQAYGGAGGGHVDGGTPPNRRSNHGELPGYLIGQSRV